ncbi:hypothetical protein [Sabulibacter ruber]|uniref:hypothetical protein n=1 Tax=Sabulibacter ruber TaxID=2811901 RepID=UPI001A963F1C|nr:hypothetical protein [Sabulibacter ruber]
MIKDILLGLTGTILSFFGCDNPINNPSSFNSTSKSTFQEQLETFTKLGFILNPEVDTTDLNRWTGQHKFEKEPYSLLYLTLGQTIEREPWTPITNKCWDFDTEAIEDHGSYVFIIENLERISRGELQFENIEDYVDIEEKVAWVSFTINGDSYKWNLLVDDDWVDTTLFSKIVELTQKYKTKGKYTYFDTGGQNAVLGFETPAELEKIKASTGLTIEWLD